MQSGGCFQKSRQVEKIFFEFSEWSETGVSGRKNGGNWVDGGFELLLEEFDFGGWLVQKERCYPTNRY